MSDGGVLAGGCLCGAVRYEVVERPMGVVNCHCGQCRRFHGHFGAYITIPRETVAVSDSDGTLSWYRSSAKAQRGFCSRCGSSLFWNGDESDLLDVAAGSLDQPTGLATLRHIHVADKADYYTIDDGLERFPRGAPEPP
ncbi:aldehyde-activating protein (plasmid) [Azospirillum argentinense]|uniref:Aldehyde-activating protein n=1 Tax=Azospirillum argentinense TaxID=2970906 RepID=A0A2K1G3L5_9PROT|nr:GFA family protein [Azospirillum argentinense]AIB14020.1 aldehyde-activating protein [Azospirillum argentinense]EZQ05722.1 aldehyde-activating protein [Azospirillum argentinense]KAA1055034.1 Gfa-like protein [Azospirillum argentinense]PNQ99373.1 GFA family protein [Azospirillum argentinense]